MILYGRLITPSGGKWARPFGLRLKIPHSALLVAHLERPNCALRTLIAVFSGATAMNQIALTGPNEVFQAKTYPPLALTECVSMLSVIDSAKAADSSQLMIVSVHNWSSQIFMAFVIGGILESIATISNRYRRIPKLYTRPSSPMKRPSPSKSGNPLPESLLIRRWPAAA